MGSSSRNTHERNERKGKGKSLASRKTTVGSQNSKSPPSIRSGGIHISPKNPTKNKPSTHRELSMTAINKKLRRFLEFSEGSSQSTDNSLEEKKQRFEKHMKLFYEGLSEVDKVLSKVVSKFSPQIQKQILESPKAKRESTEEVCSTEESVEFITHICVLVYNGHPDDDGVWFEMNPRDRFRHIFEDYSVKLDTTVDKITLHCLGCAITPDTIAEESGVKDGDRIGVKGTEDFYFNTNTHVKQVTFVQVVDKDAIKWTTTFPPTERMIEVYNRWAEYAGYKYNEFFLMHNQVEIPRVGVLGDYPIKKRQHTLLWKISRSTDLGQSRVVAEQIVLATTSANKTRGCWKTGLVSSGNGISFWIAIVRFK